MVPFSFSWFLCARLKAVADAKDSFCEHTSSLGPSWYHWYGSKSERFSSPLRCSPSERQAFLRVMDKQLPHWGFLLNLGFWGRDGIYANLSASPRRRLEPLAIHWVYWPSSHRVGRGYSAPHWAEDLGSVPKLMFVMRGNPLSKKGLGIKEEEGKAFWDGRSKGR